MSMCIVCSGSGRLLSDTCPLCDGVPGWPESDCQHTSGVDNSQDEIAKDRVARRKRSMGEKADLDFTIAPYMEIRSTWPVSGRVVLAQYTQDAILVYAAFESAIVAYAAKHQTFRGAEKHTTWDPKRMSWVKTNFLWMQYRSGWGTKPRQTGTVGLWIKRSLFDAILASSMGACHYSRLQTKTEYEAQKNACRSGSGERVTLQWDPDHTPGGEPVKLRRAVQLGLKGAWRDRVFDNVQGELLKVLDLTAFVEEQSANIKRERWPDLRVAQESVYPVPADISDHIGEGHLPDDDR